MTTQHTMLFRSLFANKEPREYIQVAAYEPLSPQGEPVGKRVEIQFFQNIGQELDNFIAKYQRGHHVFFGVAPRLTPGDRVEDVSAITAFWADLDVDPKNALESIRRAILPPSAIVLSGRHIQAYWRCKRMRPDDYTMSLMREWQRTIGADLMTDARREFRVPGTQHVKDPHRPLECKIHNIAMNDHVYAMEDFVAITKMKSTAKDLILAPPNAHDRESRSERDWSVIKRLVKSGMMPDTIILVCQNSPFGARYQNGPEGDRLLKHDLSKALAEAGPNRRIGVGGFKIVGYETLYDAFTVANFSFTPTMLVENPDGDDVIIGTVRTANGEYPNWQLPRSAFNRLEAFLRCFNQFDTVWMGTFSTMQKYAAWLGEYIRENAIPVVRGTESTGVYKNQDGEHVLISSNQIISSSESTTPQEAGIILVGNNPHHTTVWKKAPLWDELAYRIIDAVVKINRPEVIYPMLGWTAIAPVASVLRQYGRSFPVLNVYGSHEAGKTQTVKVMMQLLGKHKPDDETTASTKPFVVMRLLSSTNAIPVSLCEFRTTNKFVDELMHALRYLYDGSRDRRGRSDLSIKDFELTAPVILTGEDAIADPANMDRSVRVHLRSDTTKTPVYQYAFKELQKIDVSAFAQPYLRYLLHKCDTGELLEIVERAENLRQEVFPGTHRVLNNYSMITAGLMLLQRYLYEIGVPEVFDVNANTILAWYKPGVDEVIGPNGKTALQVDNMMAEVVFAYLAYATGGRPLEFPYRYPAPKSDDHFAFHFGQAYNWWRKKRRSLGMTVFDEKSLHAQLADTDYYQGSKSIATHHHTTRMSIISLPELRKVVEVPETLPEDPADRAEKIQKELERERQKQQQRKSSDTLSGEV